jgi:hypothetical protein
MVSCCSWLYTVYCISASLLNVQIPAFLICTSLVLSYLINTAECSIISATFAAIAQVQDWVYNILIRRSLRFCLFYPCVLQISGCYGG